MIRSRVVAVDNKSPLAGNKMVWDFSVYYDVDDEHDYNWRDGEADEIAGHHSDGGGCGGGSRDLQYVFESEEAAKAAYERFQGTGFRFYCHESCLK